MAMDIYDSQYLLILAPSLVIALMFLFFWLFMKETSYDEVLARQKRDLKLPPSKPDTRKKGDKKKNKKKESSSSGGGGGGSGGGGGGGGGGESEEDLRDFDVADAASSSTQEEEEEAAPVVMATPAPPPVAAPVEAPPTSGLRERRKKEKKAAAKAAAAAVATLSPEVNGAKPPQPSPPPPTPDPHTPQNQAQTPSQPSGKKKDRKKQKVEAVEEPLVEAKVEQVTAPVPVKEVLVALETRVPDGTPPAANATTGSSKKKNSAKKQKTEPAIVDDCMGDSAPANHQSLNDDALPKGSGKKQKIETDKENCEVKLKELLSGLGSLVLSEAEAVSVVALLREKIPNALDVWNQSAAKPDSSALERERLLATLQEEASIAKDKVKQLSQELQVEKQGKGRAEALLMEQRGTLEKERNVMQAKAQGSYQEVQGMQMKFQQLREQLEGQISRLQQENGILRDAVSSATNQMETKQTSELNQLRSEYSGLMKELAENTSKLQQEEHQRKNLEGSYKQNVSQLEAQLQDAKRRWEELQNYLHSVNTEREKLQSAKQDLQSQLLAVETDMSSKELEVQTLHSSLTDTLVSKEQLEQKILQLLEASQHSLPPDDALTLQVQELLNENKALKVQVETMQAQCTSQATTVSHFEELQKLLAEKELQRKSLEDSLNAERSSGASRETNMQAMRNENMSLTAELQNLQAQISEQTASQLALDQFQKSIQEREENIKTVEDLLKTGLIEVANKEEELKAVREENETLKREMDTMKTQATEQTSSDSIVEVLQSRIQEREDQIKALEEGLQASQDSSSAREEAIQALEQQLSALQTEVEERRQREEVEVEERRQREKEEVEERRQEEEVEEVGSSPGDAAQIQDLQAQLAAKEQEVLGLQVALEGSAKQLEEKEAQLQEQLQVGAEMLAAKEQEVLSLQVVLEERAREEQGKEAQLEATHLQQQQQSPAEEPSQELLTALAEKEQQVSALQAELAESRDSLELHRRKNNENQAVLETTQAECRELLHRLLPHVPLPSEQNHQQWLQMFESGVANSLPTPDPSSALPTEDSEGLAEKLKESEAAQKVLQKDCETYKKVLAETEGILQRLQDSVEKEENRWKVKLELSQAELSEMAGRVTALEQEVERLGDAGELDNLRRDKQHLEAELERAERESATYVTEVRELKDLLTELQSKLDGSYTEAVRQNEELTLLKTQLTVTLSKLETEVSERQKVAGDLYKAQQSLERIQEEIFKESGLNQELIENSNLSSQTEELDRKEKMTAGLNQTVRELQQLLQAVNRQLTKGQEGEADKDSPEV